MSAYEPGELVNVHITGARVSDRHAQDKHLWLFADDDAFYLPIRMLANPAVNVSHAAPKEWPPIPGDIWETSGIQEWACRHLDNGTIQMASLSSSLTCRPAKLHDFAPVKLVHRRGWTPETSPAGRDSEPAPEGPVVATTGQPGDARAEVIAGFRELIDYIEAHPDVPFDEYTASIHLGVSNLDHMRGKDEPAMFAEVARIADALGVEADLRDEPGAPHPRAKKSFRGGVKYTAVYITEAYQRGYKPAVGADETAAGAITDTAPAGGASIRGDASTAAPVPGYDGDGAAAPTDIAQAEGMVAGPDGASGPATAPAEPEHRHVGGSAGGPGDNSAECACGVVFAGFDTHAEAVAALDRHIANPAPKQDWWFTFGSGQTYDGKYVVIHGTYDGARDVMLAHFGRAWSMQYASAQRAGVEQFGLVELPADLWPTRMDVLEAEPDPCPVGDPNCETGDDGSCHDGCVAPAEGADA